MKKSLIVLITLLMLFSGYALSDDISVHYKETVGIDDVFKARIFVLCISGYEFVQSFAVWPGGGTVVSSEIEQIYEEVDGSAVPKKCMKR